MKVCKNFRVPVRYEESWHRFLFLSKGSGRKYSELIRSAIRQVVAEQPSLPPPSTTLHLPPQCPNGCAGTFRTIRQEGTDRKKHQCGVCGRYFFRAGRKRRSGEGQLVSFFIEQDTFDRLLEWGRSQSQGLRTQSEIILAAIEWWLGSQQELPVEENKTRRNVAIPPEYAATWQRFKSSSRKGSLSKRVREALRTVVEKDPTLSPSPVTSLEAATEKADFYIEESAFSALLAWGERQPLPAKTKGRVVLAAIDWWLQHSGDKP